MDDHSFDTQGHLAINFRDNLDKILMTRSAGIRSKRTISLPELEDCLLDLATVRLSSMTCCVRLVIMVGETLDEKIGEAVLILQ